MSYFKGTNRNGPTAWCPTPHDQFGSLLAAATSANGISDSDFNSSSYLEIFNVDTTSQDFNIPVVKKLELPDRVHSLAWGKGSSAGVIACGLPSGAISLIDAASVLGEGRFENPIISSPQKHNNQVTAIKFNKFKPEVFASGSSEVLIWNLANIENPVAYAPGVGSASTEPITDLQWNEEYFQILGTSTQTGKIIVWDLRNKKVAVQFNCKSGSIAWSPLNSMQLITSSEGDDSPILQLWDLKNTRMPIATLTGHNQAIWSTSWCPHDPSYLLSTGKENRAICWNVSDNSIVDDISLRTEWNSNIQWNPIVPGLFSVTSDQGQISVYSLNDVKGKKSADGRVTRTTPPAWLKRPAGATFGFGGKLIEINNTDKSVALKTLPSNQQILEHSNKIESLIKLEDTENYCKDRANNTNNNEEADVWNFIGAQFASNSRTAVSNILGFSKSEIEEAVSSLHLQEENKQESKPQQSEHQSNDEKQEEVKPKENDVSNLFENSGEIDFGNQANEDDPFNPFGNQGESDPWSNMQDSDESKTQNENNEREVESSILELVEKYKSAEQTFTFLPNDASEGDHLLTKALILGNYSLAVDFCLRSERLADALLIAVSSNDESLLNKTREAYFKSLPKTSSLHLLEKVSNKQLLHLIAQSNTREWRCTLAVICSYASDSDFSSLCTSLGEYLEGNHMNHEAVLCYITARNLGRAISLWEKSLNEGSPLIHLQSVVEKITIFRKISNYSGFSDDLASKYCDYAIILASHGLLQQALDLVSTLDSDSPKILDMKDRLKVALGVQSSSSSQSNNPFESSSRDFDISPPAFSVKSPEPRTFNPFNPAAPAPFQSGIHGRAVPPAFNPAPFSVSNPVQPVQPAQRYGVAPPIQPVQRPVQHAPPLVQPIQPVQPVRPAVQSVPLTVPGPVQPIRNVPPVQPVSVPPMKPVAVQPVQPVQPVTLAQPVVAPQPIPNRFAPSIPAVVQPVNQPRPVVSAPGLPTTPVLPTQQPRALQPPSTVQQRPTPAQLDLPKIEPFPEVKKLNLEAGALVDRLIAVIEGCKQHYQQSNPEIVKDLEGCGNDRLDILKQKLQNNELTPDTVTHLENFVKAFSESNNAEATAEFEWLSKNKYTELTAKVMLGLKKLSTATSKFR